MTRELRIIDIKSGKVVHSIALPNSTSDLVEKTMSGLRNHIDTARFRVEDSADDKPAEPPPRTKTGRHRKSTA